MEENENKENHNNSNCIKDCLDVSKNISDEQELKLLLRYGPYRIKVSTLQLERLLIREEILKI